MTDVPQEPGPLSYATPVPRVRRSWRLHVLVTVNALAAMGSLAVPPLAAHIYSCTETVKWCHVQAVFMGIPSAIVLIILLAFTVPITLSRAPNVEQTKSLKVTAWLLWAFAASALLALFGAVVHNSK